MFVVAKAMTYKHAGERPLKRDIATPHAGERNFGWIGESFASVGRVPASYGVTLGGGHFWLAGRMGHRTGDG